MWYYWIGLIILEATYFPLEDNGQPLPNLGLDVTIPLQALVQKSQLFVPAGRPKVSQLFPRSLFFVPIVSRSAWTLLPGRQYPLSLYSRFRFPLFNFLNWNMFIAKCIVYTHAVDSSWLLRPAA